MWNQSQGHRSQVCISAPGHGPWAHRILPGRAAWGWNLYSLGVLLSLKWCHCPVSHLLPPHFPSPHTLMQVNNCYITCSWHCSIFHLCWSKKPCRTSKQHKPTWNVKRINQPSHSNHCSRCCRNISFVWMSHLPATQKNQSSLEIYIPLCVQGII